jgi:hypothetical protein
MKTSELTGAALDWAVGVAEGMQWQNDDPEVGFYHHRDHQYRNDRLVLKDLDYAIMDDWGLTLYSPSTDWAQAGPIIEQERLTLNYENLYGTGQSMAYYLRTLFDEETDGWQQTGPTPLIAAMRCYVTHKLGNEVDVPVELINQGETA